MLGFRLLGYAGSLAVWGSLCFGAGRHFVAIIGFCVVGVFWAASERVVSRRAKFTGARENFGVPGDFGPLATLLLLWLFWRLANIGFLVSMGIFPRRHDMSTNVDGVGIGLAIVMYSIRRAIFGFLKR